MTASAKRGPGRPPLDGGAVKHILRLPATLDDRLRDAATRDRQPIAEVVREALDRELRRRERRAARGG